MMHSHLKRFRAAGISLIGMWLALCATAGQPDFSADERAWLAQHPVIRVAPDPYFPPIEWIDSSGAFCGIAADYTRLVEEMLGVKFQIVRCATWDEVLAKAKSRDVDMLSAAAQTPNRREYVSFTEPHLVTPGVIITRKSIGPDLSIADLKGMKVAIVSGYVWHEMVAREHPEIIIDAVPDMQTGLRKVSFGLADAMIENVATATWGIEREGITNLMIRGQTPYSSRLSFASRNDWPELNRILEKSLAAIDKPTRDRMYQKWIHLGSAPVFAQSTFWISLGSVLGGAALLLLFVVGWNRSLQRQVAQRTSELEAALKAIPDGLYVVDRNRNLVLCNDALKGLLAKNGMPPPKIGRPLIETLPPSETPYLEAELEEVFATGQPHVKEHQVRLTNQIIVSLMRRMPIAGPNGKVRFVLTAIQDLTEERQMIHRMRDSEHLFSEMVENANSIILCMDKTGVITFFNTYAETFFGFTAQEIMGRNVVGTIVPERASGGDDLGRMIHDIGEHPALYEANVNENIRKDGSRVWISWKNKPIYTLEGEFSTMLCVGNDITQLKRAVSDLEAANSRADEALAEAQKRYRFLFEESPAGSLILNSDGVMIDISNSLAESLGYTREEVIGRPVPSFVVQEDREEQIARLRRRFQNQHTEQVEVRVHAKDGSIRTILFSGGQALLREPGKPESVLVTGIDITDRKNAEALARLREQELVRTDKLTSLGTLVSGVAHEINNPNNFIILNAGNIRDVWASASPVLQSVYDSGDHFDLAGIDFCDARDEVPRLIKGITDGAERISVIVDNLKDFVRPETPSMDQVVDLNRVVEAAGVILANMIKKSTDGFDVDLARPAPSCLGNFQKLEQVVINLIANACQALPDRGRTIRVSTSLTGDRAVLEVADKGSGIAREHLLKVFDPFFTTKRDSGGTGLGLSISYSIVKEHGGDLTISSVVGEGTTVRMSLPARV